MDQQFIPAYQAYQQVIDLALYHAFAELVVRTSQEEDAWMKYRAIEDGQIWQQKTDVQDYFEPYGLRYPGEVLERFEDKLGTDARIFRALALALGKTRSIQSEHMFVGNQRGDFVQKIRRAADGDVYLQGTLYLLETDAPRKRALLDQLADTKYAQTEEAMFVLSLFDDREEGYRTMHSQLVELWGQMRTVSLIENRGLLEWLIRYYNTYVKAYRGKADLPLRTLMKLPYMNMKQDSREFAALKAAGYRAEEIILTNSLAVWADRIPDRLASNSMTAEKIAVACCQMLLNCTETLPEPLYEYMGWLFAYYKKFAIMCQGASGLWAAVKVGITPTAPQTILWMKRTIKADFLYRFDVFDPRYDILAKELDRSAYLELFTEVMLYSRKDIPLKRWLTRYRELTGAEYTEYFEHYQTYNLQMFALLVEKKELDLWQYFEQHKEDNKDSCPLGLIRGYALAVSSWRCFRFVRKLLSQYTFPQLQSIFGSRFYFHECFIRENGYRYGESFRIHIVRPFLTPEQNREFYEWVDTSIFQTQPEKYKDFILYALQSSELQRLYEKPLLAAVLRQLLAQGTYKNHEVECLKKQFYSAEELEAERRAEAEKEEQEEQLRRQQKAAELQDKLTQLYDGSLESLLRFTNGYYYRNDKMEALNLAFDKMLEWPAGYARTLSPEDTEKFFDLCGKLALYEPRPRRDILNMVWTTIGGQAA